MAGYPNKLIKVWQELKRRKVFSVVTTYAATSYIIIEVTNNLATPLHLPDLIATLILIILLIGLPFVIILSWIFDFTPQGIKKTESLEELESKEIITKPVKRKLRASYVLNAILIIVVLVFAYPKVFKRNTLEKLRSSGERISVAVMPFKNMTNDTIWNVWQDGIQNELITSLTNSEELKVRQIESIIGLLQSKGLTNYASITPTIASDISQKLETNIFIYGSIKQVGITIRLNAQLIDNKSGETYKSFQIDGIADNILHITDSLSIMLKDFLILSKLRNKMSPEGRLLTHISTKSPEAYKCYIYGRNAYFETDYRAAEEWYLKALEIDSNFTEAALNIPVAYSNQNLYMEAKEWCLKLYEKRDQMPTLLRLRANLNYAYFFETPNEEIEYDKQSIKIDDQSPLFCFRLGFDYIRLFQYEKAIPEFLKALEIYNKWNVKVPWIYNYTSLAFAYHETGQFKKEKKLYKKVEKDFHDDPVLLINQTILMLTEGDTIKVKNNIEKYKSIRRANSWPEAAILTSLAGIFSDANKLEKAEEYFRKALSLQPENPLNFYYLAYFLIDKDRNINEGIELINRLLEVSPDDYEYLDTKGWGLYKQDKYQDALEILQKSWDIRKERAIYDHDAFLHLEAAQKTVANQKRTDR